ncbi:hypothetical protein EYC80_007906 [Monilinia laxa]|uniref:Transcription factor domain-containing protein n=1 Tax=Monilinia laxa TaxID=61186 RepID=A0A5N6JSW3_MONLA|nr:hypothetical protein EYC80_007906 [Monilinia laxa]
MIITHSPQPFARPTSIDPATISLKAFNASHTSLQVLKPKIPIVETQQEYRYFSFFKEKTARRLCGFFDSNIWTHIILQAGEQEQPIRHAAAAIGALDLILHTKERISCLSTASSNIEEHHIFALRQYDKAVKLMKTDISLRGHSLRTTLLFCLLVVCFENLYGTQASATAHIKAGIRLIEAYHREHASGSEEYRVKKTERQDNLQDSITFGISSPVPSVIEDEIYQAFGLLEIAFMSFNDNGRGMAYHILAKNSGSSCMEKMPPSFASLPEAKAYWDLIMRRLMHLLPTLNATQATMRGQEDDSKTPMVITEASSARIDEQQRYLTELMSWEKAFSPVYRKCRILPNSKDFAGATILRLRWILCRIAVSSALISSQVALDNYLEDFREVLNSAKALMSHPAWTGMFTFDSGIISQVYIVALKCRDFTIRSEAISTLLSKTWREGVWDSALAGNIARAVVSLEEEGRQSGFIPESKRVYQTSMQFDLRRRTGIVKCFRNSSILSERSCPITKSIKW